MRERKREVIEPMPPREGGREDVLTSSHGGKKILPSTRSCEGRREDILWTALAHALLLLLVILLLSFPVCPRVARLVYRLPADTVTASPEWGCSCGGAGFRTRTLALRFRSLAQSTFPARCSWRETCSLWRQPTGTHGVLMMAPSSGSTPSHL
jgi:hypothetical protein